MRKSKDRSDLGRVIDGERGKLEENNSRVERDGKKEIGKLKNLLLRAIPIYGKKYNPPHSPRQLVRAYDVGCLALLGLGIYKLIEHIAS